MIGSGNTKPDAQRIVVSCLIANTAPRHVSGTCSKVTSRSPCASLVHDCATESPNTTQSTAHVNVALGQSPCTWNCPVPLPPILPFPSPGGASTKQKMLAWNPPANTRAGNRVQSMNALPNWTSLLLIVSPPGQAVISPPASFSTMV